MWLTTQDYAESELIANEANTLVECCWCLGFRLASFCSLEFGPAFSFFRCNSPTRAATVSVVWPAPNQATVTLAGPFTPLGPWFPAVDIARTATAVKAS